MTKVGAHVSTNPAHLQKSIEWLVYAMNLAAAEVLTKSYAIAGKGVRSHIGSGNTVKVCLDTCHAFTSSYDIKTPIGLKSTLEEF
ncbi:hypothetical protein HYS92_02165 [Candidatus Daviesbacteria bacterium]|nr:hypothetical protein [Candidatus Daviesbacteria bacterium]